MAEVELTFTDVLFRLTTAALAGGLLGIDREARGKPAGVRTHALVALGSALVVVTMAELVGERGRGGLDAMSRVIQGIIAGIGFVGGGVILKSREREDVRGLTTAASVWIAAALGVSCGAGYWRAALLALLMALVILVAGEPLERLIHRIFHRVRTGAEPGRELDED